MVKFLEYSLDEKKLKYRNSTSEIIPVRIDFYEGYTNSFMFSSFLDLLPSPEIFHYTYLPQRWKNMRAYFYNQNTNEMIAPFFFDGDMELKDYDLEGYITKIQKNNTLGQQAGVNDVLREHFCDRQYENLVDIEEGDVVVDVGFNYGIFSLGALRKGASKIYGFEPNKNIFEKLKDFPRKDIVEIYNLAVSNVNQILTFYEGDNTLGSSLLDVVGDFKESYQVNCINFFEFISEKNITKIDFLKVDCEGTEYEIFESIPDNFFKKIKKIHVEFHNNDGERVKLLTNKLDRNGFEWQFEHDKDFNSNVGLIFAKKKNIFEKAQKVVLISSYCDTEEKLNVLEKNIKTIKENNIDVILISPHNLDHKFISLCDYFFVTKDNPIFEWPQRAMFAWKNIYDVSGGYKMSRTYADYGFAGLTQVKQLSEIALNLGYEQFFHMIYDLEIDDSVIQGLNSDKRNSIYPSKRGNIVWGVGLHFMIFDKTNLKNFISKIKKEDYLKLRGADAFVFLHSLKSELNYDIELTPVSDEIYFYENYDFFNFSPIPEINFFIEKNDETLGTIKLFFYGNSDTITLKLEIENEDEKILQLNNMDIVDLGFNKFNPKKVEIVYNDVRYDISETINKIRHNVLIKL